MSVYHPLIRNNSTFKTVINMILFANAYNVNVHINAENGWNNSGSFFNNNNVKL